MKVYEICFSPTGGTKKAADILAGALAEEFASIDLTDSRADFSSIELEPSDLALLAVPCYGGRVPAAAIQRLTALRANGAGAVLVCVYGNRAYEDALAELQDAAKQAGFQVLAAVAAVAEHSIARQFAAGRPDQQDQAQLAGFARQILSKWTAKDLSEPSIPGNRPYKKSSGAGMVPKPTKDCVQCGLCAEKCPVQAIDPRDPKNTDPKLCISCMRCVSVCPHSARKANPLMLAAADAMLKKVCSERKENELYI